MIFSDPESPYLTSCTRWLETEVCPCPARSSTTKHYCASRGEPQFGARNIDEPELHRAQSSIHALISRTQALCVQGLLHTKMYQLAVCILVHKIRDSSLV